MKKLFIVSAVAFLAISFSGVCLAQAAQDLGATEPNLLPNSPFYFLKEWGRGIQSFFAFGNLKKTELQQKFANEKLLELKKMVEEGKVSQDVLEKATSKYNRTIEKIKERADKIKEKASENEDVNKFLEKFINQQALHEKILEKLEGQVPAQALKKIREARELHIKKFGEVVEKLTAESAEKIKNPIKCKALKAQIDYSLKQANYCNEDADCKISDIYCNKLVNKTFDLIRIEQTIKTYAEKCSPPVLVCAPAPSQENVECVEKKCVIK
jgi:hypothetical protein